MNDSKAISALVAFLVALVIIALIAAIYEGTQRSAQRKQEITLACIDHAETSAEAVICRNKVSPA